MKRTRKKEWLTTAAWFTEPVRLWWPDFKSRLCDYSDPLCMFKSPKSERAIQEAASKSAARRARGGI